MRRAGDARGGHRWRSRWRRHDDPSPVRSTTGWARWASIGRRHYAFVNNLNQLLALRLAGRAIVAVQGPIALADDTEPEPDVAIIRRRPVPYKEREAYAEDALLLIEVAESSLAYDRSTKLRLYAAAGIPEYWVVDCVSESIEVHRTPHEDGYRDVARVVGPTATVAPQAFPDVVLVLADIFA